MNFDQCDLSKLDLDSEICHPISNLKDVYRYGSMCFEQKGLHVFPEVSYWVKNYKNDCHVENTSLKPREKIEKSKVPKTLVCHDMKGGYLEDKFINGTDAGNGYTFYRWSNIDIFIYFSHHLVTIPPTPWINLAHRNNVKILGTFITEVEPGEKICNKIFESEKSWRDFANSLVNICIVYKFDGWLLNIENKISNTDSLVKFIEYLTQEIHKLNSEFIVLWYDSVTKNGELKWQNELNELNNCYFDVCDGIFLNYTWKEVNLKNSVINACDRVLDVYVGVDVFGRNFFGGGGFNTSLAAEVIRKNGLSMAIFAQGWTHETLKPRTLSQFYNIFCHRDHAFWLKLIPYLYSRPIEKPFTTTFYTGSNKMCYNLEKQEIALTRPAHSGPIYFTDICNDNCDCIQLNTNGCMPHTQSYLISKFSLDAETEFIHRLFTCNINVSENVSVITVTKTDEDVNYLSVVLVLQDSEGVHHCFTMDENRNKDALKQNTDFEGISTGWEVGSFHQSIGSSMKLLDIGVILHGKEVLLGGFSLKTDI